MLKEVERMRCRYCGNEDRASEGYPCDGCGTFICIICSIRGVTLCQTCEKESGTQPQQHTDNSQ